MELSNNCDELDHYLQDYLQNFLQNKVEEKYLKEFIISLFPLYPYLNQNVYSNLLENMDTYYNIKINKNISFEEITQ